ncbi:universal stress protein [Acidisoma sp. L85]|uniref:universal stress protein n=1 Tax=Acidisoma sp. L85 TaxID=1641850 RepID=UPI00131B240F|nr:universal stress protein [Acidisoma sp. L85]
MTYANVMVYLELGQRNGAVLEVTRELATRFGSRVIGIAARRIKPVEYADGLWVYVDSHGPDWEEIERAIEVAEEECRTTLAASVPHLEFRSSTSFASLTSFLAQQARSADLFVAATNSNKHMSAPGVRGGIGDLVMEIGRPVLLVPPSLSALKLEKVMIAWKDTREARRAASEALPLLQVASKVSVVETVTEEGALECRARLQDVAKWLGEHQVTAAAMPLISAGNVEDELRMAAAEYGPDLVVAGAYGHPRLREWVFGGVTRDFLLRSEQLILMSH